MPLRFWRRKRILPGLTLNLSKSGVSVSLGRRGARYTVGGRGQRATVGLPGSGLFWTEKIGHKIGHATPQSSSRWWMAMAIWLAVLALAVGWIVAHA